MLKPLVIIIDDDQEVTASLRWLLESMEYQVETYSRIEPFLLTLPAKQPNCLIVDIRIPVISGLELPDLLKQQRIKVPIIFISGHGDISMAVDAIKEGAIHFLTKPINNQVLLATISDAVRQDITRKTQAEKAAHIFARVKRLTPREQEVMYLMVKGKLNKTIADELGIRPGTVELHRAQVMSKMEVTSFAELVSLATQYGFGD
jgi:FixJ family two-component response regulator